MKFFREGLILFYILLQHSEISAELPTPILNIEGKSKPSNWPEYILIDDGKGLLTRLMCSVPKDIQQPSCQLIMVLGEAVLNQLNCKKSAKYDQHYLYYVYGYTYPPHYDHEEDNGKKLYCKAIYDSGNKTSEHQYTFRIATAPDQPEISGPEAVTSDALDATFTWTCDVLGGSHETPEVRWKFGNKTEIADNLYSNTLNKSVNKNGIEKFNVNSTLRLFMPKDQQSFNLTCYYIHNISEPATHRKPEKTTSVIILNLVIKITCTPGPLMVNDRLSCSCSVSGSGADQVQLSWPGYSDDAQVNIASVTMEDNGLRFVCSAQLNEYTFNSTEYILTVNESTESTENGTTDGLDPEGSLMTTITLVALVLMLLVLGSLYCWYKHKKTSANQSAPSSTKMTDSHLSNAPGETKQPELSVQVPSQASDAALKASTSETPPGAPPEETSQSPAKASFEDPSKAASEATFEDPSKAASEATFEDPSKPTSEAN